MGRRLLWRGILALLLAAAIVLLLAWLTLRASLPPLAGTRSVAGLSSRVTIERDAGGIPVITASNRADLAFATGFVHGQDRFFQMDLIRRQSAGELSALVGSAALDLDRTHRLHRFRTRAAAVVASLHADDVELLRRYADGVNAGLASLAAKPFEYFLLRADPEPWQAEDSLLAVYTMFLQLNDSTARKERQRASVHAVLPAEVYAWLYPQGSEWDAPLAGTPREALPVPAAALLSLREVADDAPASAERGRMRLRGSNNWAVGGALTGTGRALVANDMHLGLGVPNIYYRARLIETGTAARDVSGVTLPGTPLLIAGSNTRIAWGFTNSYGDYTDAVLLEPGDAPGSYLTPDGERRFERFDEVIDVRGAEPVRLSVRETIWGPVLEDARNAGRDIAVSWIAHHVDAINLGLRHLESASTVADALDIANRTAMPPQNFVVGDDSGNIGWTIAGRIPRREGYDPQLPADWSRGAGWQGWVDAADYPRIVNPPGGRIWTANARVVDGAALELIGDGGYDLGARARQIRDALQAADRFLPADMLALQLDDRALFLARWQALLLEVLDAEAIGGDAALAEYRRLVENWVPRAAAESVGYRLVRAFRLAVANRLFHALMAPVRAAHGDDVSLRRSNQFEAPLWSIVSERPMHLLPAGYGDWDAFFLAAVRENLAHYEENYAGELSERSWGELNTVAIRHPLSRGLPWLSRMVDMPAVAVSGDADLPKAQGPSFGASERFAVSPGDEAAGILQMPAGQSGHPLSAFYAAGHAAWLHGDAAPFLPGETLHTLTLLPAAR